MVINYQVYRLNDNDVLYYVVWVCWSYGTYDTWCVEVWDSCVGRHCGGQMITRKA